MHSDFAVNPRRSTSKTALRALVVFAVATALLAVPITAHAATDTKAPTWPVGSTVSVSGVTSSSANLSWTAATDNVAVTGYRVYVNGSLNKTVGNVTSTSITGLTPSTGYTVRVEARDAADNRSAPGSGLTLAARQNIPMGTHPHSVKAEDVNGDGDPDLIVAAAGSDGVTIRLGDGSGGFGSMATYRSGEDAGQNEVYSKNVVRADLDGSGGIDLVVANQNSHSIGVLLGNGNGTFQAVDEYASCSGTHDVAVGYFDADGDLDVAAVCHGANVMSVWLGNGDGTLGARTDYDNGEPSTCGVIGQCAHALVVGEFNGANTDIAIGAYGDFAVNVTLGNGSGGFGTPVSYSTGQRVHDIALGDFNEDGEDDVVTANESGDTVTVFLGDGDGTFTQGGTYSAANGPKGVTVGYLDADSHLDIAVGSDGGNYGENQMFNEGDFVTVLLGNGNGTFGSPKYFGTYTSLEGESVFDVDIADVNGDGRADLLASHWWGDTVGVFLAANPGGPSTSFTTTSGGGGNNPPVAVNDGPFTVVKGQATSRNPANGVLSNDTDDGGMAALTAHWLGGPGHGSVDLDPDGAFTYTHNGDSATSDSFTYYATDGENEESNAATVSFTIEPPPNVPPVAVNDSGYEVDHGSSLVVSAGDGVLDNDYDTDGSVESAHLVSGPSHGSVTLNESGSFTYTHNGDGASSDTFRYRARDDDGAYSGNATVTVTINPPPNQAPVARDDGPYAVQQGEAVSRNAANGVLANDTDDGDSLTAHALTSPAHGSLDLNSDGSFEYTHNGGPSTTDSFTYRTRDDDGTYSEPATVRFSISSVNVAPAAVNDGAYSLDAGVLMSQPAPGVLGNDTDDVVAGLTAVKVSNPSHGTVTLNSDGSFTYMHNGDSATSDSFTYRARDAEGLLSNIATVSFTIVQPLDGHLPVLVDPGQGRWHMYDGSGGLVSSFYFGNPGDYPFMGDWNGDGVETPGLYRQSDGYVYLRNSNTAGPGEIKFFFGNPGDVPIAGDFNNDGKDTVSIYRPSNQTFYIINKLGKNDGGLGAADFSYVFGNPGDKPFVGDFDGDGVETVGLHRESTGLVYFRNVHKTGNADAQFIFGDPGDRIVAGDWNDDGTFSPGLFRPSNTTMYFRYTNNAGNADNQFVPSGSQSSWIPVSGKR